MYIYVCTYVLSCFTGFQGNEGKVDESLAMMTEVEELKKKRKDAEVCRGRGLDHVIHGLGHNVSDTFV